MNAIEIRGVTKTFGNVTAVKDLSLSVPKGSVYGFIGPNGSGKTTTLRMIMNIIPPDSGTIEVFGETLVQSATDRIGYLPEERGLYKKMKVRELLLFYGGLKNGTDLARKADAWLERFDLSDYAGKKVESLSKGMTQKLQFIATVIAEPELLILDEPFAGLDPVNTDVIRSAVVDLQKRGTTVVFSTHDMSVAEKLCDFIFMIFRGEKVLDGTLTEIQDQYGADTLRIRTENGDCDLTRIEGVASVKDLGRYQELRLMDGTDPQEIVARILEIIPLRSFEIAQPSLHDIFVRIAGPDAARSGEYNDDESL